MSISKVSRCWTGLYGTNESTHLLNNLLSYGCLSLPITLLAIGVSWTFQIKIHLNPGLRIYLLLVEPELKHCWFNFYTQWSLFFLRNCLQGLWIVKWHLTRNRAQTDCAHLNHPTEFSALTSSQVGIFSAWRTHFLTSPNRSGMHGLSSSPEWQWESLHKPWGRGKLVFLGWNESADLVPLLLAINKERWLFLWNFILISFFFNQFTVNVIWMKQWS